MVFTPSIFDETIFDTPAPTPPDPISGNFSVYQNGVEKTVAWSRAQLLSISLSMAAYDGQVGTGAVTLPGAPEDAGGWQIGDRISFVDPDAGVLYTGYLMRPQVEENPDAPTELQTAWQLMDVNRLFVGLSVTENQGKQPNYFLDVGDATDFWASRYPIGGPSIDALSYVFDWYSLFDDPTSIIYDSDGATAWIGDVVRFTGYTVFMGLTSVDNELQLHVTALASGPLAGIVVSDRVADIGPDTWQPGNPVRTMETTDLKDGITGRNGVVINAIGPAGTWSQGGLGWEATLDVQVDENSLALVVNSVQDTGAIPKPTYSFSIYNVPGLKVAATRAGWLINLTGEVFDLEAVDKRIAHETLTVSRDEDGNPRPGFWDMSIETDYPFRSPTAVKGYGGQGSGLGAISTYRQWVKTRVTEDNPGILVGETETATAQLLDKDDIATAIANVSITWTVVQNDYDDLHPDYSPLSSTSLTDESGQASMVIGHISDFFPTLKHRVKAEP